MDEKQLKARTWTALSPQTAAAAGCTLHALQQWLVNAYVMQPAQLQALARHYECCGHA